MPNRIQDRIDSINEKMKTVDPAKLMELERKHKLSIRYMAVRCRQRQNGISGVLLKRWLARKQQPSY